MIPLILARSKSVEKLSHSGSISLNLIIIALKLISLLPFLANIYICLGLKTYVRASKSRKNILAIAVDLPTPELP